ncbi:MAG TPA: hypothetical protein VMC08_02350 [Bacteroidales bacterium]|nr:hypothetical protein [Bacteroidales bacterium]
MKRIYLLTAAFYLTVVFISCNHQVEKKITMSKEDSLMTAKIGQLAVVRLTTDLTRLTDKEKQMIPILIDVAKIMEALFWEQSFGNKENFLGQINDSLVRRYAEINYGAWDRLNDNKPFMEDYGTKPAGANFYPYDMTKEEFGKWKNKDKTSPYTLIRRNEDRSLKIVWFHDAWHDPLVKAASLLHQAAALAEDQGLKKYLELRAEALLTDNYFKSDIAWMEMKNNTIDMEFGPIENYEDGLFGYKDGYEATLLVKDKDWSSKLQKFAGFLPQLQKELPADPKYKKEVPASGSDLNAYDAIYVAGHTNAGGKSIAINLPNDEKVQALKGSRRLQLKNLMQAKFDHILVPISRVLIDSSQRKYITFDAFFSTIMFHEVAHGLGIRNTITHKGTVREALKEKYASFEEGKADVLGLFMTTRLIEMGEIRNITPEACYVTFMAGLLRSVRFGASDAHGKANMMCFNFFQDHGAFERTDQGTYKVDFEKFKEAMNEWGAKILAFEGDGDYAGASAWLEANGKVRDRLQSDLDRLKSARIPVDIVFDQGLDVLGLK